MESGTPFSQGVKVSYGWSESTEQSKSSAASDCTVFRWNTPQVQEGEFEGSDFSQEVSSEGSQDNCWETPDLDATHWETSGSQSGDFWQEPQERYWGSPAEPSEPWSSDPPTQEYVSPPPGHPLVWPPEDDLSDPFFRYELRNEQQQKQFDEEQAALREERRLAWEVVDARLRPILLDTEAQMALLVSKLEVLTSDKPQVVIDCEGFPAPSEERYSLDIIEVYLAPEDQLYLVDLTTLGDSALHMKAINSSFTLAKYLASSEHRKIMWDCRSDGYYLNFFYDVRLAGVFDASLAYSKIEADYRRCSRTFRTSVTQAIEHGLLRRGHICEFEFQDLENAKEERSHVQKPRVWSLRPLPDCVQRYARDVRLMFVLYEKHLAPRARARQLEATIEWASAEDIRWVVADTFLEATGDEIKTPWSCGYRQYGSLEEMPEMVAAYARELHAERCLRRDRARAKQAKQQHRDQRRAKLMALLKRMCPSRAILPSICSLGACKPRHSEDAFLE